MSMPTHLVIGAGQAGAYAAIAMREAGFRGRIVLIGDEPHLPYSRPPLSKAGLIGPEPLELEHFFDHTRYANAAVELRLGTVVEEVEPKAGRVRLGDGSVIPYDRLILATGSRAKRLAIPGAERVFTLRTSDDAARLRTQLVPGKRVVCIGAGVIGLEVASSARALGCAVTVLEAGQAVMTRSLSSQVGAFIEDIHRKAGVELWFGVEPVGIEDDRVRCADGTVLAADIVVAGIGMQRNTELADAVGLAVSSGILTDPTGLTSTAGIYAAGEVAAVYNPRIGLYMRQESWRHAQQHGSAVGRTVGGVPEVYDDVPWFWSDQHGVNIQIAGGPDGSVSTVFRGVPGNGPFSVFYLTSDNLVTGVVGLNANREVAAGIRLIRSGRAVDPAILTNPSMTPQKMVAEAIT